MNLSKRAIRLITAALVGIVLLIVGIADIISATAFKSDVRKSYDNYENDITVMAGSEYEKNQNVYGDILYLYGCFCEETTTNTTYGIETSSRTSGYYYLMPIISENETEEKYITILVKNSDSAYMLDAISDDTYDFLCGEEDIDWHDYFIIGKVKPLESDVREFMIDWFKENEWFDSYDDSEMNKYIVPYQIEEYDPDAATKSGTIFLVIGLIVIAVSAAVFIYLRKKANNNNSPEAYIPQTEPESIYNPPSSQGQSDSPDNAVNDGYSSNADPVPTSDEGVNDASPAESAVPMAEEEAGAVMSAVQGGGMSDLSTENLNMDSLYGQESKYSPADYDGMNDIDINSLNTDSLGSCDAPNEDDDTNYTFDSVSSDVTLSEMDE